MKESLRSELPKLAMDDIPTPAEDAVTITGLVKEPHYQPFGRRGAGPLRWYPRSGDCPQ